MVPQESFHRHIIEVITSILSHTLLKIGSTAGNSSSILPISRSPISVPMVPYLLFHLWWTLPEHDACVSRTYRHTSWYPGLYFTAGERFLSTQLASHASTGVPASTLACISLLVNASWARSLRLMLLQVYQLVPWLLFHLWWKLSEHAACVL